MSEQALRTSTNHKEVEGENGRAVCAPTRDTFRHGPGSKGRAVKLTPRFIGPYKVLKSNPSSSNYTLDLPDDLRKRGIHPVFHVSQLEPAPPNTIPNRVQEPPVPVEVEGDLEFEVELVLDSKYDNRCRCRLRYKVKWRGYDGTPEETSWQAAVDLEHSAELVEAFHTQHPDLPGSYAEFQSYF